MRLRDHAGSLALLVIAIGAGVAIVVDRGTVSDAERTDRPHDVFPAYRRSDIDFIELDQHVGNTVDHVRIERRLEGRDARDPGDGYWQMTAPVAERADPAAVDRFVGDLEFAGAIRRVDATAPDVASGFAAPRVKGTIAMKSLVYHFALGGAAPTPEGARYFRVDGEGTFVVSREFAESVSNGPDTYRERSVVPYLSLDLARLVVTSDAGSVDVTRRDDLSFVLTKSGLRASREGMDRVWSAIAEARADAFLADDVADRALGPSPVTVVMTPKDATKPRGEFALGGPCPGHGDDIVFVRTSPSRVSACVPKGAASRLRVEETSLVDHRLFAARPDEIEELTMETDPPGFAVELARKGHGWHERRPTDRELPPSEVDLVNAFVEKLTRGEASGVERADASDAAPGFHADAKVSVRRGGSGVVEVVLAEGTTRVKRAFDDAQLQVPAALGRRLHPSEIVFRSRGVFPEEMAHATPVAVSSDCDGVKQRAVRSTGADARAASWVLKTPSGYAADPLATSDLVAILRNAQADSWVADRDDGSFGLDSRGCTASLETSGDAGARMFGITFGRATDGGYFARTTSDGAVFVAPRALRDSAASWIIDRAGFAVDPADVLEVVLSRPGSRRIVLKPPRDAADGGATDAMRRVLETLAALRPDMVLHLGAAKPDEGFDPPTLDVRVKVRRSSAAPDDIHFMIGDTALINRERVTFLRRVGADATFAVARERVAPLLDAL
jgi:hypothetical protein